MHPIHKVLIAGGTGLIGYHSALEFLKHNIQVDVISCNSHYENEDWFDKRIHVIQLDLFSISEEDFLNQIKDKNYDCFVYALGPDDRVIPNAPAYDFFYDKLVTQCKKICSAVKKAKIKRCILLGSYFAAYDRKLKGKLSKYHPYILARVQQEKEIIELKDNHYLDVMILELPYIFGVLPGKKPLWRESFLKYFDSFKYVIFPKNGGTALIDVDCVAQCIYACALYGLHGKTYLVGKLNLPFKELLPIMLKEAKDSRKYKEIPAFIAALGAKIIDKKFKKKGLESGLNHAKLMTQIQNKKFYADYAQLKKELHFEELKLDGGSDIFECISKTMQACYPERFNFMKGE